MVHRDIELVRLTGARAHFLHLSTAGSVELVRRAKADGLAGDRRGDTAPHQPHRRTARGVRRDVQGQPAAAHPCRRRRRAGGARRRHDRCDRHRPCTACPRDEGAAARPGASRDARARDVARRVDRPPRHAARRHRRRPVVEAGGDRRRRRPSRSTDRGRANRRTSPCSTPTSSGRWCPPDWRARAATPPTSARRCAAGSATRSSTAIVVVTRRSGHPMILDTHALDWMFMQQIPRNVRRSARPAGRCQQNSRDGAGVGR